jgi:hypothetical protein
MNISFPFSCLEHPIIKLLTLLVTENRKGNQEWTILDTLATLGTQDTG